MVKLPRPRRPRSQLQSPLLALPPELRNKIYHYALVRTEPIDLWPHKWIDQEVSKTSNDDESPYNLKVRHQKDLEFVRKEMCTGLLGTCSQVYREASLLFWGGNQWKFSGRSGWQGLLRFLLTIGPEARARIRTLEVHAPIYMRWPVKDSDNKDMNGRSKNYPKMHMAKISEEGHLDREAIQRVCAVLCQERFVEAINFIIPSGFRNGDEDDFGGYDLDHDMEPESRARLERLEDLDFVRKTVIVENGGYLAVSDGPAEIMAKGWDLTCLPGSFIWEKGEEDKGGNTDYEKREVTQTRHWISPARALDFLDGVKSLFNEEDVSVHSCGGKQMIIRPAKTRKLSAFGGCQFIEDDGVIMPVQNLSLGLEMGTTA